MNSVNLIGNLTKDPQITYTTGERQTCIARFTIAINGLKKADGTQMVDFPSIVAYGKQAEVVDKYVHKGNKVGITGRIHTGSYETREGGTVYFTEVVADRVELLTPKAAATPGPDDIPAGFTKAADVDFSEQQDMFTRLADDDIPF